MSCSWPWSGISQASHSESPVFRIGGWDYVLVSVSKVVHLEVLKSPTLPHRNGELSPTQHRTTRKNKSNTTIPLVVRYPYHIRQQMFWPKRLCSGRPLSNVTTCRSHGACVYSCVLWFISRSLLGTCRNTAHCIWTTQSNDTWMRRPQNDSNECTSCAQSRNLMEIGEGIVWRHMRRTPGLWVTLRND